MRKYHQHLRVCIKMNSSYKLNGLDYELVKDYKDGFSENEVIDKMTDYFVGYDYVVGDWAYGKLRLKGFCDRSNKKCNRINDIKYKDKYIKDLCSYECRYFIVKKVK